MTDLQKEVERLRAENLLYSTALKGIESFPVTAIPGSPYLWIDARANEIAKIAIGTPSTPAKESCEHEWWAECMGGMRYCSKCPAIAPLPKPPEDEL